MSTIRLSLLGDCVIHVNDTAVDPSSTHLFALLLVLGLEGERRVHRSELQQLLFAPDIGSKQASHNLRQLLYRVRRIGVKLDETTVGIRLVSEVTPIADQLTSLTAGEGEHASAESLAFLPSYTPRLPKPYLEWLDQKHGAVDALIRGRLRTAAARHSENHSWTAALRVSTALLSLDPHSDSAISIMAEALAMLGRRQEALSLIDSFDGFGSAIPSGERLRPLRARIARLGDFRKQGTMRGRGECLSALESEWEKIGAPGARRAVLIGNAGIGKSRVAEAFAVRIGVLGGHVTRYACDSATSEQPLALFRDILLELRGLRGSLGASPDLAAALDRLRPETLPEAGTPEISVEAVRAEIQRAIIDLLEAISEEKPLLLLIDDAHYLDSVSANVIRSLCSRTNSARLLVLLCIRRSQATVPLVEQAYRGFSYVLDPLPTEVSRQVIIDVAGPGVSEEHLSWCLAQAAGNPFYLHTLASQRFVDTSVVPFDIRSLASNAYASLAVPTRSVLETCLLLGRLATLGRVARISGVLESEILSALRELEALDLIQFSGGALIGPHALLHDALTGLIPTSVAALLHMRIASELEKDWEAEDHSFAIAWPAAQSWLAAGEPHSAARLVRQCARQAAAIGETTVATALLSRVMQANLPVNLHAALLDELIGYAEVSAAPAIIASATRTRLKLARAMREDQKTIREFECRIIEAELTSGQKSAGSFKLLFGLLLDDSIAPTTRANAAARLMIIADEELDVTLAKKVFAIITDFPRNAPDLRTACNRTELVFHTFCGDTSVARELATNLLRAFPVPNATRESFKARAWAGFALQRLSDQRAVDIAIETYEWALEHGIFREAVYSASALVTIAIAAGDLRAAREWLGKSRSALNGEALHELSPQSGLYCDDAFIAMHEGRYADAERLIIAPADDYSPPVTARYCSVTLALRIRLRQLMGENDSNADQLPQLEQLYARGKTFGGQDIVVEALWTAQVMSGNAKAASKLLSEYLKTRREKGPPEWSLYHATSADEAWLRD